MPLSAPDWVRLNSLLDQVLDLEPDQRGQWMESLPHEYESLRETLRDLLSRRGGLETAEVLRRAPSFAGTQSLEECAGDVVGPYRLIRRIGAGGMATVWLAERADGSLQRQVALKLPRASLIDRDLQHRLNREHDILASLEHPGIARLYDAGTDGNGRPYLAMEYVDGMPLDRYVAQSHLTITQRLDLFVQMASAVACAHARLVVHRDLKPANVLVRADGEVRLLDFGIAHLLHPDAMIAAQNAADAIRAFTPCYAAPEQFEGQPATVATDVYSLGVVLYELLVGRSPYPPGKKLAGKGAPDIVCFDITPVMQIVDARTARLLRGDLEAILYKALEQHPRDRYESVSEFIRDIQRHRGNLPVLARPDSARYRTAKFIRRHVAAVAMASALLVAVVAGASVSLWQARVALRERDHSLRLFHEAEANNDFWSMVLTEGMQFDEPVTVDQLLNRSERMAEKAYANSPFNYSVAMDAIAALYLFYGKDAKAHALTAQALERIERAAPGSHRAASLQCSYAVAIGARGDVEKADAILASMIDRVAGEPDLQQYCLQCRYYVAYGNNDAVNALRYIRQAYEVGAGFPSQSDTQKAKQLSELAMAYAMNGEPVQARRYYDESMSLLIQTGREESRVAFNVLSGSATLAINTGDPAVALERYQQLMALQAKHAPDGLPVASVMGNHANALALLGRYAEALAEYERMQLRSADRWGDGTLLYALAGTAEVQLAVGDVAAAQTTLERVDREVRNKPSPRSAAMLRLMMVRGRVLARQGRLDEAHGVLTAAMDLFDSGNLVVAGRTRVHISRAEVLLSASRLDEALEDSRRAVEIAATARMPGAYSNMLGLASMVHGEVLLRKGDASAATQALRDAAINLQNTVGNDHPDTVRAQKLLLDL